MASVMIDLIGLIISGSVLWVIALAWTIKNIIKLRKLNKEEKDNERFN